MIPQNEHTFLAWFIIIGAVCIATLLGALINRVIINRSMGQLRGYEPYYIPKIVKEISPKDIKIQK